MELRIDPEFKGKIPPLTEAEYLQLRDNILEAGEVYEPIVTWNGIIVDGHNRWKIIQENPTVRWKTREMNFADKWEAFDWMYKNQLGRRNLTDAQRTYLIGKLYEARKNSHGGDRKSSSQNGNMIRVSEELANELGSGKNTVIRAEKYANGIDAIREESPETADAILSGKLTPKKRDVTAVGNAEEESRAGMIQQIEEGKRVTATQVPDKIAVEVQREYNGGGTSEYRERRKKIAEVVANMYDDSPVEYTLEDLLNEIRWNADAYIRLLSNTIHDHEELIHENIEEVKAYIAENVTMKIKKIEEEI